MFALVKPFLIAVAIIIGLLLLIGVIRFEKPDYGCFRGKEFRFGEKVNLVDIGSFKVYGYPLIFDCPQDDRYDPKTVYPCGVQTFCQRDSDETEEVR